MMISSCFSALWVRIDLQHPLLVRETVLLEETIKQEAHGPHRSPEKSIKSINQ